MGDRLHPHVQNLGRLSIGGNTANAHRKAMNFLKKQMNFDAETIVTEVDDRHAKCVAKPHVFLNYLAEKYPHSLSKILGASSAACFKFWDSLWSTAYGQTLFVKIVLCSVAVCQEILDT